MKTKNKPSLKSLKIKADRKLQESGSGLPCEMCGLPGSCFHHIASKASSSALRYCPENLVRVCQSCHLKFHSMFAPEMIARLTLKRGQKWFDKLQTARHEIVKPNRAYYEEIMKKYGENTI